MSKAFKFKIELLNKVLDDIENNRKLFNSDELERIKKELKKLLNKLENLA